MTNLPLFFNGFQCFKTFSVPSGFIKTCFQPDEDSNQVETLTSKQMLNIFKIGYSVWYLLLVLVLHVLQAFLELLGSNLFIINLILLFFTKTYLRLNTVISSTFECQTQCCNTSETKQTSKDRQFPEACSGLQNKK